MGHCHCLQREGKHSKNDCERHEDLATYTRIAFSSFMLISALAMETAGVTFLQSDSIRIAWYAAAYIPVALPVLKEAWQEIMHKDFFNEFLLMSIATFGAFYTGQYPEGVAVMLFYSLGEMFQEKAVRRARNNISALLDVRPERATVIRSGNSTVVHPREVQPGETIEVKTGERVPLDGMLQDGGSASFNTSALTGESLPRTISRGEEVLAGMIATDRAVRISVTRPFEKSALSRILEIVQKASAHKAPTELFIRRFARIYTPCVMLLAVLIVCMPYVWSAANPDFEYNFNEWLYRGLVFLVISCPCALVISIPLGYFGGIGAASRLGILFKGGNYLDAMTHVNAIVFDKTGTLTNGTFEVSGIVPAEGMDTTELLRLVADIELHSTHPIAQAIRQYAAAQGIVPQDGHQGEVREMAGLGLEKYIDRHQVLAGNRMLMERHGINLEKAYVPAGNGTDVLCAVDGSYVGCLTLSDTLKEDAGKAIDGLKALNIRNIQILSGDKQSIVTNFAGKLGISQAYGDLLPEDKVKHIREMRRDPALRVAFVGDGINDAPSLAISHVGIAMGGLGSDVAIETADVVIQTDQPSKIATAIRAGRHTRCIIRQNILMAIGVKVAILILGACGMASLWEAVFADVGVAMLAILNAIRLQKIIK